MKNIKKIAIVLSFLSILGFAYALTTLAQGSILKDTKQTEINNSTNSFADQGGYDKTKSLEDMIATAIRMVLATLGTIFIVFMFVAGNMWMQAAGNEEKIKKSKARIQSLVIGLIIVLIAYALSSGFSGLLASALLRQ